MQLTKHFRRSEFDCRDGSKVPCKYMGNVRVLAENLEVLRAALGGNAVRVTSGYRSPDYNKKVGGVKSSQHLTASAADIQVAGYTPRGVQKKILELIRGGKMKQGGVGIYRTFVHYDIRGRAARWGSRK